MAVAAGATQEMAVGAKKASQRPRSYPAQHLVNMSVIDHIAHELLIHPRMSGAVSTKQLRTMLRYKAGIKELPDLSNHIHSAVDMLVRERILEHVEDIDDSDAEGASPSTLAMRPQQLTTNTSPTLYSNAVAKSKVKRRRKGRRCFVVQKRSWAAIEADGFNTAAAVRRLLLLPTYFV